MGFLSVQNLRNFQKDLYWLEWQRGFLAVQNL